MSQPDEESHEALKRLDKRLETFDAGRAPKTAAGASVESGVGQGYRLLGEVIGGVLGGLGLGWAVDYFAHTTPIGIVVGLLLGTAGSAWVAMKSADRMSRAAVEKED
jgi:ATP synthase protein I